MTHTAEQIVMVRGTWHGHVSDPGRIFKGKIIHSDLAGLRKGTNAEISFGHSIDHAQDTDEHGTYTLVAGSKSMPLMSFTCRTVGTTGQHSTDDAQEADWQAVPLYGNG